MAYPYPTNLTKDSDVFVELMQWTNDISGGAFGLLLLLAIIMIVFISSYLRKDGDALSAFASSMFIGLILSILLVIMGILHFYFVILLLVGLAVSIIFVGKGG